MSPKHHDKDGAGKCGMTRRGFIQLVGTGAGGASFAGAALATGRKPVPPEKILEATDSIKIRLHINGVNYGVLVEPR